MMNANLFTDFSAGADLFNRFILSDSEYPFSSLRSTEEVVFKSGL